MTAYRLLRMGDAVTVANLPAGLDVYAGYVNGHWPTYPEVVAKFPAARHLSIAVTAAAKADCLDVEPGDATNADAAGWMSTWQQGNTVRPVLYTSASNIQALIGSLAAKRVGRERYWIWSAHYNPKYGAHICGPRVCDYPQADATQWTDHDNKWDESLIPDYLFTPAAKPPVPAPAPKPPPTPAPAPKPPTGLVTIQVPVLQQGATGPSVVSLQRLLTGINVDGVFGPNTHNAVVHYQAGHHLTADGIVGNHTWGQLLGQPQ